MRLRSSAKEAASPTQEMDSSDTPGASAITHLILVGPMGAGKTTVGRLLSRRLEIPFHDSDAALHERTGETGADIAGRAGVARLHQLELETFLEMARKPQRSVICPAASVIDSAVARAVLRSHQAVWLDAPHPVLEARRRSGDHRRSLKPGEWADLLERRRSHYAEVTRMPLFNPERRTA